MIGAFISSLFSRFQELNIRAAVMSRLRLGRHQESQQPELVERNTLASEDINSSTANEDHYSMDSFNKKYKTTYVIGTGGNGTVRSGHRIGNPHEVVAVKEVKCVQKVRDGNAKRVVPKEVELMMAVADVPGMIRLLDWYLIEGNLHIVMEQPEKVIDMSQYLQGWILMTETQAREWFRQVVETVVGCYKLGIIHCDIKDLNLLIDRKSNQIKLIDFGSGAYLHEFGAHFQFGGTRLYAPPEFFEFNNYEAIPATVWSLGILLFKMLNRRLPFMNRIEIIASNYKFDRMLSPECSSLIGKCLARYPNDRITLDEILQDDWFNAN